jgi:hypothetical protein
MSVSFRHLPLLVIAGACVPSFASETPPLRFVDDIAVTNVADGGLRPVVGVHNLQVYRANRSAPAHRDGLTDTYLHAPMLAYWKGRYWVQYLSGPVSEHESPCATSLTSSIDGVTWEAPRTVFPSLPLPDGKHTLAHQRMGFYVAPDGRLLTLAFHGREPSPNDGTGFGRVVREIFPDGSFGPIHVLRVNVHRSIPEFTFPYPSYRDSTDAGFVAACEALLADKLMTVQWWEEEQLDETNFYRFRGKAASWVTRPDGSVLGIWKNRVVATTHDRGESWQGKSFAENVPNNGSKYWLQRTSDDRYALVLNPTNRNRHPLAVMVSEDSETFRGLYAVHGELPDQRFGGYLKNMGPQYVRGIVEGNGTPPDMEKTFPLTYSVNKEDMWFARVPVPVTPNAAGGAIRDSFDDRPRDLPPEGWNVYSPLWAPVRVTADPADAGNQVLSLRDEDPYDYARAVRIFPETHGVKISFRVQAAQTDARLEIELLDAAGARPVRLAFLPGGRLEACHEGQWLDAGTYTAGQWHRFELEIPPEVTADRCVVLIDGASPLPRPAFFTDPVTSVERLSFRTGEYRERGYGGRDLPGADVRAPAAVFLVDDVSIEPLP